MRIFHGASRKGALRWTQGGEQSRTTKGAKEENQKSFLCGLGVLARKSPLKRSVEHSIGKNLKQDGFCTPYHPLILTRGNHVHLLTQLSQGGSKRSYEVNERGQGKRADIGCEKVEDEAELWEQIQNFRNPDVAKCE